VPGETNEEVAFAGKKTVESVKSTERIMEAVDILRKERENASVSHNENRLCRRTVLK